jgi:hypothetical protein
MFEKIMLGVIVCLFIATPFVVIHFNERTDQCEALGGTMVKTAEGWVCFKMVRLEKTT